MNRILAFHALGDAIPLIDHYYRENQKAMNKILDRHEKLIESMPDEFWDAYRLDPELAYQSDPYSYRTYDLACAQLGNGLELTCVINLEVLTNRYYYEQALDSLRYTEKSGCYAGYGSVEKLAKGVQKLIAEQNYLYNGATVNPVFYTIQEENPVLSDCEKQELKEALKSQEAKRQLKEINFLDRIKIKFMCWCLLRSKDTVRGLTKEEIEEFERLMGC